MWPRLQTEIGDAQQRMQGIRLTIVTDRKPLLAARVSPECDKELKSRDMQFPSDRLSELASDRTYSAK